MLSINELLNVQKQLENEIEEYSQIILNAPSGRLVSRGSKSGVCRFSVIEKTDENHRFEKYLNKNNLDFASLLANKMFAEKKLKDLKQEKKYIDAQIEHLSYQSSADAFLIAHPELSSLIHFKQSFTDPFPDFSAWENEPYERNQKYPEYLKYPTVVPGLFVRSKSEADIVALLKANSVPFHYEEIYTIGKINYAIDFICLNIKTGKKWFWDHQNPRINLLTIIISSCTL